MKRKSIFIAILLLLAAAIIIILQHNPPATAPGTDHAASQTGAGAHSKPLPPSTIKDSDQELVARYGDAKTKQARKTAALFTNIVRYDLEMIRMNLETLTMEMTSNSLLRHLDLGNTGIAFSEAQYQKVRELCLQHEKQFADRAEKAFTELESKSAPIMKYLLAGDACAQGQGDLDEYNRLRSSLEERLKGMSESISDDFRLGLNIRRDPLDSPEFHGELVKLLDPEQIAALDEHLNQAAAKRRENTYISPQSLDKIQEILTRDEESARQWSEMTDAIEGLIESGIGQ